MNTNLNKKNESYNCDLFMLSSHKQEKYSGDEPTGGLC